MSAAENLPAVQDVEFNGDRLSTFEKNGERWVAMRPIVEAMGLSWGGQSEKLTADPGRFNYSAIRTVGADGKSREMGCIPLRRYPMWLATINPAKIPNLPALSVVPGGATEDVSILTTEVAELTGKQHKHVLVDTRNMLSELGFQSADFSSDYVDARGRRQQCFRLPKRELMILMTVKRILERA